MAQKPRSQTPPHSWVEQIGMGRAAPGPQSMATTLLLPPSCPEP